MSDLPKALVDIDRQRELKRAQYRQKLSFWFNMLCMGIAGLSVVVLVVLLITIGFQGSSSIDSVFLTSAHDPEDPEKAGMYPAIIGSVLICVLCALTALPIGIGSAVFLEEFRPRNKFLKSIHGFVQLNISNLAGVPSIVYGLLGLTIFVYMFQVFGKLEQNRVSGTDFWGVRRYYQILSLDNSSTVLIPVTDTTQSTFQVTEPMNGFDSQERPIKIEVWSRGEPKPSDPAVLARTVRKNKKGGLLELKSWYYFRLPFGSSFLAAGLTLALVILPIIVISSQEALRAVPPSLREASLGMGSTQWQTVRNVTLPAALPGILTGSILAMGRAIGEAAPIFVVLGGNIGKRTGPESLMDSVVTMPILIFGWSELPAERYRQLAAGAIIVLLIILLMMNSVAIYLRQRMKPVPG